MSVPAAWQALRRLKEITDTEAVPANVRGLAATAEHGEAWMMVLLAEHGLAAGKSVDEIALVERENGMTTLNNLAAMLERGDIGPPDALRIMHASGFTNGLALGLTLTKHHDTA